MPGQPDRAMNPAKEASVDGIIETLREEHQGTARLLKALEHQIGLFAAGEPPDYDVIVGVADYVCDFSSQCHHPKEDALAARLLETHPAQARAISGLLAEHGVLQRSAREFREAVRALLNEADIARETITQAAHCFLDTEWAHMRAEETHFFPLADLLFSQEDWAAVDGVLFRRRDPVFGDKVEASFRRLRERLLAWEAESLAVDHRL
jgi:hemerythrin-like domain-containing protein